MVQQITVGLKNTTTSSEVYCYVTGTASNNSLCLIQADGHSIYYPTSPATNGSPLAVDCGIRLGAPGTTKNITVPQLAGGRIWFSVDAPLVFLLNQGPALIEPAPNNLADPNINTLWAFCEFTLNDYQLFTNISYVDFVAIPIAMSLTNSYGNVQLVKGIPQGGLATVCQDLVAQKGVDGQGWDQLVVKSPSGQVVRAISPNMGIVLNPNLFAGYFEPYVDLVYQSHTTNAISVDTQSASGVVQGYTKGNILDFTTATYVKPSTKDIFSCSSGPFVTTNAATDGLTPRLAAAFNRSTLHLTAAQPADPSLAYQYAITNHYSRILHQVETDGRGYAFPYDDVTPSGGLDQSGSVSDANPTLLTIMVGGLDTGSSSPPANPTPPTQPTTIDATSHILASKFNSQSGGAHTEVTTDVGGGMDVGWISNGQWLAFNNVDFHSGLTNFSARVASGAATGISGFVQVCIDSQTATPVASFAIANTGGWQSWVTMPANMTQVSGVHTLYLTFASGQPSDFVNVNWVTFN